MEVNDNGTVNVSGSNNKISGGLLIESGGDMNVFGSSDSISGSVSLGGSSSGGGTIGVASVGSSGTLNVFGASNTITGSLYMTAGALNVSGMDASLAVTGTVTLEGEAFPPRAGEGSI